ncbi:MAG: TolC family protein [Planctomycetes bacterium]|uniref:TolC family protein n=1 Tax=Candidatus Wunengus sp. YC65 TaxID=3367701 RepID=UPI001DF59E60|nr:TolC family protein [Planctomycetota bacterium]
MTHRLMAIFIAPMCIGVLTGCVSVPKEAGFPDVHKIIEQRIGSRVHWNQGTSEDAEVVDTVRSMLQQELTVDESVQIALLNNRSLQATYEELGIAQADLVQAGLLRNPTFGASFRFPDKTVGGHRSTNTEFSVVQDFLDLLVRPLRKKVAAAQFEQTKLRVGNTVLNLAAEVRSAYYSLQADEQTLEMRRTVVQAMDAAVDIATRQHDAGTLKTLDLANQQGFHDQAKLDMTRTDIQLIADRERLNRLMGLWGADTTWKLPGRLPELSASEIPLERLESLAVSERLDLAAARQETLVISHALSLTRKYRYFYVFDVGVDTEHDVADNVNLTGPNLTIELPIFDQRQAEISRLEAQLRQSQQRLSSLAIDIRSEIREIRDRLWAARNVVKYYHDVVLPLRKRIVDESQLYYNGMLIGVYELLFAKQNQINAGREYIEALRDYWITRSDLERAVGGRLTVTGEATRSPAQPVEQPAAQSSELHKHIHH